jgi:hypothetical protein
MQNWIPTLMGSAERIQGTRYVRTLTDLNARIIPLRALDNERKIVIFTPDNVSLINAEDSQLVTQQGSIKVEATEIIFRKPIIENGDLLRGSEPWEMSPTQYISSNGDGPLGTWWAAGTGDGYVIMFPRVYKPVGDVATCTLETSATVDTPTDVLSLVATIQYASAIPFESGYLFRMVIKAGGTQIYSEDLDERTVGFTWAISENIDLPTSGWTGDISVTITCTAQATAAEKYSNPKFFVHDFQVWADGTATVVDEDLVSPYGADDLPDLHYVQSPYDPKELVITHPDYPPYRLYFDAGGGAIWKMEEIPFANTPVSWSTNNYPATCTSYMGRLVLAGGQDRIIGSPLAANSETVWATEVADWTRFTDPNAETLTPADSMEFTAIYRSPIQWAHGHKNLLIGAQEMEYVVSADGIFAPNDLGVNLHSTHGGARVQPAGLGEGVLFAADGGTKVRSMNYDNNQQGWVADDLTLLNPELCSQGIVRMVRVRNPHQMCVVLLKTGQLAIFHQESGIQGWSRVVINGGTVRDICVIADSNGVDVPFMTVERKIDGVKVLYLEAIPGWTRNNRWDYMFSTKVDNNLAGRPAPNIIPGLGYLEGEIVQVVADNQYVGTYTVESGQIELFDQAGIPIEPVYAVIGLMMHSHLGLLPPAKIDPNAPARYSEIGVRILQSTRPIINGKRPPSRDPVTDMKISQPVDLLADWEVVNLGWNPYAIIEVEENIPLRTEVLGVYGKLKTSSV